MRTSLAASNPFSAARRTISWYKLVHDRSAGEDPEIFPGRIAHHGERVVGRQVDNPVIAPERPEELDAELGVAAAFDDEGFAPGRLDLALGPFLRQVLMTRT